MFESTPSALVRRSTAHASLAALGVRLCQLDLLAPLRQQVQIPQKRALLLCWRGPTGLSKSIWGCGLTQRCKPPLAARPAPNSRSSRTPWTPARPPL
jgi:hypothetical protein